MNQSINQLIKYSLTFDLDHRISLDQLYFMFVEIRLPTGDAPRPVPVPSKPKPWRGSQQRGRMSFTKCPTTIADGAALVPAEP